MCEAVSEDGPRRLGAPLSEGVDPGLALELDARRRALRGYMGIRMYECIYMDTNKICCSICIGILTIITHQTHT